jgi:hypothetical protein
LTPFRTTIGITDSRGEPAGSRLIGYIGVVEGARAAEHDEHPSPLSYFDLKNPASS